MEQAEKQAQEAQKIDAETTAFIENAKVDIAINEEQRIHEFNEKIERMQQDLSNRNAENSTVALLSIDKSISELSKDLENKIPDMVNLICNIISQRK